MDHLIGREKIGAGRPGAGVARRPGPSAAIKVVPSAPAVLYVVGARPNFVKMAPVIQQMRARAEHLQHVVAHTGQHFDRGMSDVFFEDLGLPPPDYLLGVGPGSHGVQTARALERVEEVLLKVRPQLVIVPGDVNSTLAAALAAAKLEIPVAHLEAGLRSFDRTMPEELNRVIVDQLSRWCFIHSPEAAANLRREGIGSDRVFFVGNTMIDTLVQMRLRIRESTVHARLGVQLDRYLLVTLHRPALVDGSLFEPVIEALRRLAEELPVVFPVHPRARARLQDDVLSAPGLHIIDPVGYIDFLCLQARAAGVITDSGGVQEESTFLQVPCFTLRENTERPITVSQGTNRLLGLRPEALERIPSWLARPRMNLPAPDGWDGHAAARVAEELLAAVGARRPIEESAGAAYAAAR
ncbi:MAG: UDP-N-acetylglucosamine 2-epimerase (non-hydrolyzing) [Solirubrobacterales bacterium]|nr:UDP-N-acetylglucosamine 2-epimerase (non-hydrolyzing) [Solirubrobacterales bacterium]